MTATRYRGRLLLGSVLAVLALADCAVQGGPQIVPAGGPAPLHEVPCR